MSDEGKGDSYRHGDLPNACIAVGLRMIKEEGIAGLTLRKVARAVGVSPAAPYKHFASKEALLAAIAQHGFELLEQYLTAASPEGIHMMTRARFSDLGCQYLRFAAENPEYYRLMFTNIVSDHREYPALHEINRRTARILTQSIEVLQRHGVLRQGDPRLFASHIWALLHGFASLYLEGHLRTPPEETADPLVAIFAQHDQLLYEGIGVRE